MKTLLLSLVAVVGMATSVFSQGTINFANNAATLVTTNNVTVGNARVGGYTVALYAWSLLDLQRVPLL